MACTIINIIAVTTITTIITICYYYDRGHDCTKPGRSKTST